MTAHDLLARCHEAGIVLALDGGNLCVDAPRGALDDAILSELRAHKPAILAALAYPDPLPPLAPASEARRRKVLAMARDGRQYAILVEDPNTDPVIMALATPASTCEVLISQDRYDPFTLLAKMKAWQA